MQELKQLVAYNRKKRAFQHYQINKVHGECQPFTDREYKKVKLYGKSTYSKGKKFTYNAMWRENSQKYDFNQLKIINKS